MLRSRGTAGRRSAWFWAVFVLALWLSGAARAQSPSLLLTPGQQVPAPSSGFVGQSSPGTSLMAPPTPLRPAPPLQASPVAPPGQVALALSARYGVDRPTINAGLDWRIYFDKPDQNGVFRLFREERTASPVVMLPPGSYIVHVSFGLASAARRVTLRAETVREVFELPAGGVRFEGRVGDVRIPHGQISFDIFKGSQFEPGDRRAVAEQVPSGDVVLLPEGTYNVVSTYGDGNSVMRSDLRVTAGKLTDTTIVHRAAKITLKLVSEKGGEALANTAWSVLTPGGDSIKESIGAFPVVILAEGEYVAIARNEGRVFCREFKVQSGVDRDVEVLSRATDNACLSGHPAAN